jgi:hypothetical protein
MAIVKGINHPGALARISLKSVAVLGEKYAQIVEPARVSLN